MQLTIEEVAVTHKAKSKAFRMLSEGRMKECVRDLEGDLFWFPAGRQFFLKTPEGYCIVFQMESREKALVVTQMHEHENLYESSTYERVQDFQAKVGESLE